MHGRFLGRRPYAWTVIGSQNTTDTCHSSPRPGRGCPYVREGLRDEVASGDATRAVKRVSKWTPSFSSSSTVERGYETRTTQSSNSAERSASRGTTGSEDNVRSHSGSRTVDTEERTVHGEPDISDVTARRRDDNATQRRRGKNVR